MGPFGLLTLKYAWTNRCSYNMITTQDLTVANFRDYTQYCWLLRHQKAAVWKICLNLQNQRPQDIFPLTFNQEKLSHFSFSSYNHKTYTNVLWFSLLPYRSNLSNRKRSNISEGWQRNSELLNCTEEEKFPEQQSQWLWHRKVNFTSIYTLWNVPICMQANLVEFL